MLFHTGLPLAKWADGQVPWRLTSSSVLRLDTQSDCVDFITWDQVKSLSLGQFQIF